MPHHDTKAYSLRTVRHSGMHLLQIYGFSDKYATTHGLFLLTFNYFTLKNVLLQRIKQ